MRKAVLISIHPKWCELIVSGKKTIEVRKTRPKIDLPFKCYIYETKGKTECPTFIDEEGHEIYEGRGQVIGEFVCRLITGLKANNQIQAYYNGTRGTCLTEEEIVNYAKGKMIYYWHISDIVIYEKPKGLQEFRQFCDDCAFPVLPFHEPPCNKCPGRTVSAPQSLCYVEEVDA